MHLEIYCNLHYTEINKENDFISEPVYLHWAYLGEPSLHSAVINARASFSFHLLHFSCKVPPKHVIKRTKKPGPNMRDVGKPSGRESSELSSQIISSKFVPQTKTTANMKKCLQTAHCSLVGAY